MDLYMTEQGDLNEYTITQAEIDQYKAVIEKRLYKDLSLKKPLKADSKKYAEELAKKLANKTSGKEKNNEPPSNLTPEERLTILTELYNQENQKAQAKYITSKKRAEDHEEGYVNPAGINVKKVMEQIDLKLKREAEIAAIAYSQAQAELKYIQKYPKSKKFIQQLEKDITASKEKIEALEKNQSSAAEIGSQETTLSPKNLELYKQYKLLIKAKTYYDDTIEFERNSKKFTLNINLASSTLYSKQLSEIEKEIEPIKEQLFKHDIEENKKIFIENKKSDEAAINYYNSLDKLEDFYKNEKERYKGTSEKLKEYNIKLYDIQSEILQNRADALKAEKRIKSALNAEKENLKTQPTTERLMQEQQDNNNRAIAQEIEGRAILAKEYSNKLNRSKIKEEKTKEVNTKVNSFLGDIMNQQADFVDDLSKDKNLGPNQKKGKFLAQFLKQSVEIYANNYYSGSTLPLKEQFQSLLHNNGDLDIDLAIKGINNNLSEYINQMQSTIGKELGKYNPALPTKGEISPERAELIKKIKDNSLYAITANKINEAVDHASKLTLEEKQNFASSSIINKLYSVINYMTGNKNSQQYSELQLKEKLPAITKSPSSMSSLLYSPIKNWKMNSKVQGIANSLRKIGISDAYGISDIHRPNSTPPRRMSTETTPQKLR